MKGHLGMNTPPIVSPEAWEAARQQMLVGTLVANQQQVEGVDASREGQSAIPTACSWSAAVSLLPLCCYRMFASPQLNERLSEVLTLEQLEEGCWRVLDAMFDGFLP